MKRAMDLVLVLRGLIGLTVLATGVGFVVAAGLDRSTRTAAIAARAPNY